MNIRELRRLISAAPTGTKFIIVKESILNYEIKPEVEKPKKVKTENN